MSEVVAGRYTLVREIGRGGMGAVWLAHDEVLGRLVALKRLGLLPGGTSGPDLERAEREARLAAQLNHPHVVAVFTLLVDPATQVRWLVMEHVDGTDLARLVREQGRLSPDDAAPLLGQVADALVAAHAAGIAHRDVKPSNILVDRRGRAMLTDFGIARTRADPALTQTGLLTGSPAYLAPEVASGERGDESADVWSLGATIFHVLAGRPPYETGDNVLGTLVRIVGEEPPRLPEAGWMAPLLEATMVKDPTRRWSMEQVRDFLVDPASRSAPPDAEPDAEPDADADRTTVLPPVAARAGDRPGRRLPVLPLVGLGVVVVLLLAALTAVLTRGGPGPDDPASARSPGAASSPDSGVSGPRRPQGPTVRGMERFVRTYVEAVATDPSRSWQMLTPRFQRASGGFAAYREFWSGVGAPELLEVRADPNSLVVSYRVRFENFGTGERPTVLALVLDDGRYRIDAELTEGFEPAG
ncbi:MAG TPA: serine/threonine-protein kinase [Nocardioides sp.]|nr:serine/threonine-protein kinase [Nocardioides sp.]